MFIPKRVKHRKQFKGRRRGKGVDTKATHLAFGEFGLKSEGYIWLSSRHIEAARRTIIRFFKKGGRLWIRVFPDKPVTVKGVEVPMGGGKGSVDHYVFPVKPGRIIFEVDGISEESAKEALRMAADKLPLKTKFIKR